MAVIQKHVQKHCRTFMPELVVLSVHIALCTLGFSQAICALNITSSGMKVRQRFERVSGSWAQRRSKLHELCHIILNRGHDFLSCETWIDDCVFCIIELYFCECIVC